MNLEELYALIEQETDIPICPICGTPYRRYHSRQKTCASKECKGKWNTIYRRARDMRLRETDIEAFRKYHADAQRRSREKKKKTASIDDSYELLEKYWGKRAKDNVVGLDYGQRQAEKILETVPKIDVEGFMKGLK